MLTPVDIHNKEFSRSFRGFNQEEVDDFLDQVVNDYEMLYRDNHQMKKEIELCNKQLEQYHQLEKNLQDTLLVAQRTADEVVNTANTRGEEVRQAAKQAGENLKREAELYASKLKHDTERECKRRIEAAAQQVRAAVEEYERIVRERRQFVAKMRNLMQTELGLLEEAYDIMPDRMKSDEHENNLADNVLEADTDDVKAGMSINNAADKVHDDVAGAVKAEIEDAGNAAGQQDNSSTAIASAASVAIAAQIGAADSASSGSKD